MKRRTFLHTAAASLPLLTLGGSVARASSPLNLLAQLPLDQDTNDKILIIVQLFGGNDGLNTVIPADDDNYYKLRPGIGVPKKDCWNNLGDIYLLPTMASGSKGGMARMLEQGSLAIVQGIGYDNPNLSHFRSTDIWLSGINSSDPNQRLSTGWLGRYLENRFPSFPQSLPTDPLAIQFGGFSLALMSEKGRMGIEVADPSKQQSLTSLIDTTDPDATGTNYRLEYDFVADIANRSNTYAQRVQDAYNNGKTKLKGEYASDSLAKQLAACAALIAGGLDTKVYVVSMGGFDTHVSQLSDAKTGAHPSLIGKLSNAVAQFMYDAQVLGFAKRVTGMTISEFGRRPEENGSLGTDHGAASVQFVFGQEVNGGRYGQAPDLEHLDANNDLQYEIDYRRVYAEVLTDWFGLTLTEAREVLNDNSLLPLDVLKSQTKGVGRESAASQYSFVNYPNPFRTSTMIELRVENPANVKMQISTVAGQPVTTIADGRIEAGMLRKSFSPSDFGFGAGVYVATIVVDGVSSMRVLNCM